MAYVLGKLEDNNYVTHENAVRYLHAWDTTQDVIAVTVKWTFIPLTLVVAAYNTGTPLWAMVSPVG
jgi:hypothetical protein